MLDRAAFEYRRRTKLDLGLSLLLIIQIAVIVYLGLAPFSISPPNQVAPASGKRGLEFDGFGIAVSEGSIRGRDQFADERLSLHILIEPADEPRTGLGTILSITAEDATAPLVVAQWKTWLVVRVRDPEHRSLGFWEIGAPDFPRSARRFVSITSGPDLGTAIYVDGKATGDTRHRSIVRNDRGFEGQLLLGSPGNGSAGWRGVLSGLAIANTVLTPEEIAAHYTRVEALGFAALEDLPNLVSLYDFGDLPPAGDGLLYSLRDRVERSPLSRLLVPEYFTPPHPEVFSVPRLRDMKADWFLNDLLRNVVGFIPLGFVASLLWIRGGNRRGHVITFQAAILGGLLSLGVESVQIALPMRVSSLSDLTLNVVGAMLGAIVALAFRYSRIGTPGTKV
ncbi:MAG: hypothetical protein GY723_22405 [bacterium]|nr:hypothetical protein [bacterium]